MFIVLSVFDRILSILYKNGRANGDVAAAAAPMAALSAGQADPDEQ